LQKILNAKIRRLTRLGQTHQASTICFLYVCVLIGRPILIGSSEENQLM